MRARTTAAGLTALSLLTAGAGTLHGTAEDGREVVFVANAEGGTVTVVDTQTFAVLRQLDVVPDGDTARPGEDDPVQAVAGQRIVEAAGGENLAQDQDVSPDGRTLFVSRGHRGDTAAFDLASGELLWKTAIPGLRSDHMTLSADGTRLYVSALTSDVVVLLDASDGSVLGEGATGEWPHDNHLSDDGRELYNASIGNIVTPWETRAARVAAPGVPSPYQVRVLDADTLEVERTYEFAAGVRPFAVVEERSRLYAQLSEYHGVVEVDLESGEELRRLDLPIDEGVTEDDYSFEAPHHGLDLSADGTTLCLAGRASDYVALVDVATLSLRATVDVGDAPSWSATTLDGEHCVAANTRDGTVSFVSYALREEVARVETGVGPKHLEVGTVPADVLTAWGVTSTRPSTPAADGPSRDGLAGLPATGGGRLGLLVGAVALGGAVALSRRR